MRLLQFTSLLLFVACICSFKEKGNPLKSIIGNTVTDFSLKNTDNGFVSLSHFKDAKGFIIVFTCNHCPFAKLYPKRLNELNAKFKKQGVPLIAINPMDTLVYEDEVFEIMHQKSRSEKFSFPYLSDASQSVAKNFGITHTPQAIIIWKENNKWVIKYSGAIDDNGAHPELVKVPYVANAINELLSGKAVSNTGGYSIGCAVHYRE